MTDPATIPDRESAWDRLRRRKVVQRNVVLASERAKLAAHPHDQALVPASGSGK